LLAFVRYILVYNNYIEEKLPMWILLPTSTHARGEDIFKPSDSYMIAKGYYWKHCVDIYTDGAQFAWFYCTC
jgi:hypothetical protein